MESSFFLCTNPLLEFSDNIVHFIFHSGKPRFFAAVLPVDPKNHSTDFNYQGLNLAFSYIRGDNYQQLYLLLVDDNIDKATGTVLSSLKEAAAFYATLLSAEDEKKYGRKSKWALISDINDQLSGVKLIHIREAKTILLTYTGGIRTFSSQSEVNEFMLKNLNIPKNLLPQH